MASFHLVRRRVVACAAVAAILGLSACTSPLKLDVREMEGNNIAYARACEPFAAMSALVYKPKTAPAAAPDEAKLLAGQEDALRKNFEEKLRDQGWRRDGRFPPSERAVAAGLDYDVWVNENHRAKLVVIAVRGTDFDEGNDWWSNSYWVTRYSDRGTQYDLVNRHEEFSPIFRAYREELDSGETVVITTGHSLGGGLAQALRYRYMADVLQCYAFNTSPVTSYYDQSELDRATFRHLPPVEGFPAHLTLRVYERGEVLAYVRAPLRWFRRIPDQIREVRFNFTRRRNFVSQHSMAAFAQHLADEANKPPSESIRRIPTPWWRLARPSGS